MASTERLTRALLFAAGLALALAALLYNEWTLGLATDGGLTDLVRSKIRLTQLAFALGAAALLLAAEGVRRVPALRARSAHPTAPLFLLVLLAAGLPLALAELGLRPFVEPKTHLFVADDELGWRPRAGAVAEWGYVEVEINAKGLRGPELPYERIAAALRVLHLGDSVAFGYGLARAEDSYPYRTGARLEALRSTPVETVNAGVGGWSPWQHHAWLVREGLRYRPDLLVVGFVLNDVTEKFELRSFGGTADGWQLFRSERSRVDGWLSRSAIVSFAREGFAVLRFGRDVFLGAQRYEAEEVQWLAAHARSEELEPAWRLTFENLGRIFEAAGEHALPAALVVFPFGFQLDDPAGTGAPQQRVREFAAESGVAFLDLLPVFAERHAAGEVLFLDPSHLSVEGSRLAGETIADFLWQRGLAGPTRE